MHRLLHQVADAAIEEVGDDTLLSDVGTDSLVATTAIEDRFVLHLTTAEFLGYSTPPEAPSFFNRQVYTLNAAV